MEPTPTEKPLDGRAWFRAEPTGAIVLTGIVGGAGAGFVAGIVIVIGLAVTFGVGPDAGLPTVWIALIAGFVGVLCGIVGGAFATAGALLARAITRLFTKTFGSEAVATVGGAVVGIVGAAFLLFPGDRSNALPWLLLPVGLAAAGFTALVVLRRPERVEADADV